MGHAKLHIGHQLAIAVVLNGGRRTRKLFQFRSQPLVSNGLASTQRYLCIRHISSFDI